MYKGKRFLAIIPARGGSKGIPKKNIYKINGKPLIYYSIHEALKSNFLDRVIVSTDSEEIAQVSKFYGAEVPFIRPLELATDTSKTIDVLLHAIEQCRNENDNYDYLVLLQPTQPLRKSFHIDKAIKKIVDCHQKSLVSVSKVKEHPILMRTISKEGFLENILNIDSTVRRQDFPDFYKVNGAIYINKIDDSFTSKTSLNDNNFPFIMDEKYDLDIDTFEDIEQFKLRS